MHLIFNGKFKSTNVFVVSETNVLRTDSIWEDKLSLWSSLLMPNPKKDSKKHFDLKKFKYYQKCCINHCIEAKKILNEQDQN